MISVQVRTELQNVLILCFLSVIDYWLQWSVKVHLKFHRQCKNLLEALSKNGIDPDQAGYKTC